VTIRPPRPPRVLITGAAGRIGTYLRERLSRSDWELRLLDCRPVDDDREVVTADVRDTEALAGAMRGVDAVVHLAGISTEAGLDDILAMNVEGTWRVFDAARRAGVARVVYGGSNHAIGFTPRCEVLRTDVELRPDTNYGVSKAFGESVGRFYADRYGMQVACLRIGSCDDRPRSPRMLATWLSPDDAARLVDACLRATNLEYAVVYGISANTRGWWDLEPGRAIGYEPADNAEEFADAVFSSYEPLAGEDAENSLVGGRWTTFSGS
jgi:uronate dehydrogenase